MDISKVKIKDTTIIDELYDPAGDLLVDEKTGEPVTIEVYGAQSDAFQRLVAKRIRADQMGQKGRRQKKDEPITEESIRKAKRDAVETLAESTVSWSGIYQDGKKLECNRENAIALYEAAPFIRSQVDRVMGDDSAFFEK